MSLFGKDEVGGSNPPSSSRKTLQPQWLQGSFFFDKEVKRAAAMPVATVWLLSMMRCLRPSRTHKSLCPTLDNCANFCPRFVLLQRRPAAQVYSGFRIPAEILSAAGWIAGKACLRRLPHGLEEVSLQGWKKHRKMMARMGNQHAGIWGRGQPWPIPIGSNSVISRLTSSSPLAALM